MDINDCTNVISAYIPETLSGTVYINGNTTGSSITATNTFNTTSASMFCAIPDVVHLITIYLSELDILNMLKTMQSKITDDVDRTTFNESIRAIVSV